MSSINVLFVGKKWEKIGVCGKWPTLFYLVFLCGFNIVCEATKQKNVKYVLSFLSVSMLIHCFMEGLSVMFLLIIFSLPEQKKPQFFYI